MSASCVSNVFCRALGCMHKRADDTTPFCMWHWSKLSRKAQRAIRERKDLDSVERAQNELMRAT